MAFLFTDTQIVVETMLEDLNNVLNSGEIPNLFPQDEQVCFVVFPMLVHTRHDKNSRETQKPDYCIQLLFFSPSFGEYSPLVVPAMRS